MNGSSTHYGAVIFVEPETRDGRLLTERYSSDGIVSADRGLITSVLPELLSTVIEHRGCPVIVSMARQLVQALFQES